MTFDIGSAAILAILVLLGVTLGAGFLKRRPKALNQEYFMQKWQEAQGFCKEKTTWPLAVINADKLVDEALKQRKYKGKTMIQDGRPFFATEIKNGTYYDTGDKLEYLKTVVDFALQRDDIKDAFAEFLRSRV